MSSPPSSYSGDASWSAIVSSHSLIRSRTVSGPPEAGELSPSRRQTSSAVSGSQYSVSHTRGSVGSVTTTPSNSAATEASRSAPDRSKLTASTAQYHCHSASSEPDARLRSVPGSGDVDRSAEASSQSPIPSRRLSGQPKGCGLSPRRRQTSSAVARSQRIRSQSRGPIGEAPNTPSNSPATEASRSAPDRSSPTASTAQYQRHSKSSGPTPVSDRIQQYVSTVTVHPASRSMVRRHLISACPTTAQAVVAAIAAPIAADAAPRRAGSTSTGWPPASVTALIIVVVAASR